MKNSRWTERLARWGFAAKGFVYILIGVLAVMAAFSARGKVTNAHGAVREVERHPAGDVLLLLLAAGFFGYAAWRFIAAFSDTEGEGSDAKGLAQRAGHFFSGLAYGSLGVYTVQLMMSWGRTGGGESQREWAARLMSQPFGPWLVGILGAAVIAFGVVQVVEGLREKFRKHLRGSRMSAGEERWAVRAGKFGFIARGVVFGIIGVFLVVAALRTDPSQARGFAGGLAALAAQPYGPWLLGAVAAGLVAYGLYNLVFESRYRRI